MPEPLNTTPTCCSHCVRSPWPDFFKVLEQLFQLSEGGGSSKKRTPTAEICRTFRKFAEGKLELSGDEYKRSQLRRISEVVRKQRPKKTVARYTADVYAGQKILVAEPLSTPEEDEDAHAREFIDR